MQTGAAKLRLLIGFSRSRRSDSKIGFPRLRPMYQLKHSLALARRSIAISQVRSSLPQVSLQQSGSVANYHPSVKQSPLSVPGITSLQQCGSVAIIACRYYADCSLVPVAATMRQRRRVCCPNN